ncbi:MAG: methylmalonyl Co-A mutase-associated GTPase MeaB, partial [Caldilineaceae bacterium]|nr:methylmalonyl Co-A mutase-associated GTPase MeaB [Caldilineaceae bacterium]
HGQLLPVVVPDREIGEEETGNKEHWRVVVMRTVATGGGGVDELRMRIEEHAAWLDDSGERAQRDHVRVAHTLENILRAELNRRILAALPQQGLDGLVEQVRRRELDPYAAAARLLGA